ncbi:hypothetical protein EG329_010253 [Mollisiaceae sp. DMI_Dod_QoI]|nr:hypothetical protein EG329_010253 [Helotiales sp. DMI_Dod_QoI]
MSVENSTFEERLSFSQPVRTKDWNESSLTKFLRQQLPSDLAYHVVDAAPILYRSVLRLASYPYLLEPVRLLTIDALRTAVVLLCRRPLWVSRDLDVSDFWLDTVERKRRRLLFQSMMNRFATMQYISRSNKDDEDLDDVLDALDQDDYSVWHADGPNEFNEPVLPPTTRLPSSNSSELSGIIPRYEFRSWLRLVLLSRLTPVGDVRWRRELEAVTDSVLGCFNEHSTSRNEDGISWQDFDKTIRNSMPFLHLGLSNLFGTLISQSKTPSYPFSVPGLSQLFFFGQKPTLGSKDGRYLPLQELTHPILCQLAIFLPIIDVREHILLSRSQFVQYANQRKYPGMMLLSGLGITSQSSDAISHVIYGAFFGALPDTDAPFERAGQVCIFQLAPVHRVFVATRAPRTADALDLTFSKEVARRGFKVELVTEKSEMVELIIDDGMKNASFAQWGSHQDEGSDRTLIGETRNEDEDTKSDELYGDFRIEDMKLLGYPKQTLK